MTEATSEPTHTVRNSLADKTRNFSLGKDALHWSEEGGESQLAYKDVRDMRLIAYTSPIGESLQCTLRGRNGEKVKPRSAHYKSLNNFEDRTTSYAAIIKALALRIAASCPGTKFIAGSSALWMVWLILGILCLGVVLLLILSLFEGLPSVGAWAIAVCVAAVPLAWRRIGGGGAKTFPDMPPSELIGQG